MTKVTVIGGIKSISYPGAHRSFASSTLRSQFGIKTKNISAGRLQFLTQSVSKEIRSRSLGDNRIKTVSSVTGGLTSENGFIFDIFHGEDIPKEQANTSSNVGPGVGLALPKNGVDLPFKSLVAGPNVTLTDNPDHVVIESQDTGEANTSSNTGPGVGLALPKNGIDLPFKSLVAGTNVTLTDNPDHVVIESQDTGEANTSSNAGTGVGLALPKNGVDLPFKSLVAGSNVTLIDAASTVTINAQTSGEANTTSNAGTGIGLALPKNGVDLPFKSLKAGTGIEIVDLATDVLISEKARNYVWIHEKNPYTFSGTNLQLTPLDVTITPSAVTAEIKLHGVFSIETSTNAVLYIKRDGVEIGSAPPAGNRLIGLVPVPYDANYSTTLGIVTFLFIDNPNTTAPVTYSFWIRKNTTQATYLNRTRNDANATSRERTTSFVLAEEL